MGKDNSRRMGKLRKEFRLASCKQNANCWLCGQPIDYSLPAEHPDGFQLDHYYPQSTHPELIEDPANFRPSHAACNNARGNGQPHPGVGAPSRNWIEV